MNRTRDDSDEDEELTDDETQTEAEVVCPYCGEKVGIQLDPAGGSAQEYVEDCQVCCRPWRVTVQYDDNGSAEVTVEES